MSIRMYICRTETPAQVAENPIPMEDWKELVKEIPQMHLYAGENSLPSFIETPPPSEGLARWSGHPMLRVVWFYYKDGLIYTDGFDSYVTTRMRAMAMRLGARVIHESGSFF